MPGELHIGTSGFACRDWIGPFYPENARADELLAFYSRRLGAVEIGGSFYRLPSVGAVESWVGVTPDNFRVCLTAPRHLTQDLRLTRAHRALATLHRLAEALGEKAGPVLLQLPSTLTADLPALDHYLRELHDMRLAVELRHPSWHVEATLRLLSQHGAALVMSDSMVGMPRLEVTAPFAYWRLSHADDPQHRESWAERAEWLMHRDIELFAFVRQGRSGQAGLIAELLARSIRQRLGASHVEDRESALM